MAKQTKTSELPYTLENVMKELAKILASDSTRPGTFTILGYDYVKTIARFHYDDCDEIYVFKYNYEKPMIITHEWTADDLGKRVEKAESFSKRWVEVGTYTPDGETKPISIL